MRGDNLKEYYKTHQKWNKGKKMSKKFCDNISKRQSGKKLVCSGWNRGLTKETDNRIKKMYKEGKSERCPICNNNFYLKPSEIGIKKTCSKECSNKYLSRIKKGISPKNINQIKGWNKGIDSRLLIKCDFCGKENKVHQSKFKIQKYFFCNVICQNNFVRGINHPMFGKQHTNESRKKIGNKSVEMWAKQGFKDKHFNSQHPNLNISEIINDFNKGDSLKDINRKFGLGEDTIKRILLENGINKENINNNFRKKLSQLKKEQWKNPEYRTKKLEQMKENWRETSLRIGEKHPRYGKKASLESIRKGIETRKKNGKNIGEKHFNWQGGKSFEPYSKDFNRIFKDAIKLRDNACMTCGGNSKLFVHHIDYNKLNSIKENCCALCSHCHAKTNFNRPHWIKFFQSMLNERYGYQYGNNQEIIINLNQQTLR